MSRRTRRLPWGFTLIELVMVIAISGFVGMAIVSFIKPALDAYAGLSLRADMSAQSDAALRRMLRDVRRAVPNSIRVPESRCFELVPAMTGGRYRMGPDKVADASSCTPQPTAPTAPSASCSAWVDPTQQTVAFDTLSQLSATPTTSDFVVINNQNGNDVYAQTNVSRITAVAATQATTQGYTRITMNTMQVSPGYTGGRFQVISGSERSVFYICSGSDSDALDSNGNGTRRLFRVVRDFNATYPTACPTIDSSAVLLATRLTKCSFIYNPNQGATQQSGYIWLEMEMVRNHEASHLAVGAHVWNVP